MADGARWETGLDVELDEHTRLPFVIGEEVEVLITTRKVFGRVIAKTRHIVRLDNGVDTTDVSTSHIAAVVRSNYRPGRA